MVYDLDPQIYREVSPLLSTKNESELVKFYKDLAEAESVGMFTVSPKELIGREIDKLQKILSNSQRTDLKRIERRIVELKGALEYFEERRVSEHKVLERDFSNELNIKHDFFSKKIYENDQYRDYELTNNRRLRMRMIHPDKEEAILGADLIYEIFDLLNNQVRFVHLQYKMWEDGKLYFSEGNMKDQIGKLNSKICKLGYCVDHAGSKVSNSYRMPYCCAFLRPTNRIQNPDSQLKSTGLHIPICEVLKKMNGEAKLERKGINAISISNNIFDEMFISNSLGSRWLTITGLEKFYEANQIQSFTNRIRVHAQEVQLYAEEEKRNK